MQFCNLFLEDHRYDAKYYILCHSDKQRKLFVDSPLRQCLHI